MFKPRPYDPDRVDTRTQAQRDATDRNFGIFKLRGLHAQMGLLTGPRRELARMLVDQELIERGALSMADAERGHWERIRHRDAKIFAAGKCPQCREKLAECECIPF